MGMVGCFAAVDQATQQRLIESPEEIEAYLYSDNRESEPTNYVDVDKAWHGIHFLLAGKADGGDTPLALAVLGGAEFGDDVGYGPARFLSPEQVREVARALGSIGEDEFRSRFAPMEMTKAEIYPEGIWERDGEDALDYLVQNYLPLVAFYQGAAKRGDGVVMWLC